MEYEQQYEYVKERCVDEIRDVLLGGDIFQLCEDLACLAASADEGKVEELDRILDLAIEKAVEKVDWDRVKEELDMEEEDEDDRCDRLDRGHHNRIRGH
jgi:hypothetical protein